VLSTILPELLACFVQPQLVASEIGAVSVLTALYKAARIALWLLLVHEGGVVMPSLAPNSSLILPVLVVLRSTSRTA
jgi:hypothetical protein